MNQQHLYENYLRQDASIFSWGLRTLVDSTGQPHISCETHIPSHHSVASSSPQWPGVDPVLTLGSTRRSSESTPSDTSTNYEPDCTILGKRQTRLRRILQEASTESRLNVLPSVPELLVKQFWVVYRVLHDRSSQSPVGRVTFRSFYRQDGEKKRCLLCNHTIKNTTQMIQHIKGIHFEVFGHRCTMGGCSFSSVRAADLKRHIKEQHMLTHIRFECDTCKRSIKHEKNFRRHMKTVH